MLLKDEFYTPSEVAKLLKVSKQTVWAWTRSGQLRSLRFGRAVRVPRSDLEALLEKGGLGANQDSDGKNNKKAEWRKAMARADAIRARVKARVGRSLPSSVGDLRALREEQSRDR